MIYDDREKEGIMPLHFASLLLIKWFKDVDSSLRLDFVEEKSAEWRGREGDSSSSIFSGSELRGGEIQFSMNAFKYLSFTIKSSPCLPFFFITSTGILFSFSASALILSYKFHIAGSLRSLHSIKNALSNVSLRVCFEFPPERGVRSVPLNLATFCSSFFQVFILC